MFQVVHDGHQLSLYCVRAELTSSSHELPSNDVNVKTSSASVRVDDVTSKSLTATKTVNWCRVTRPLYAVRCESPGSSSSSSGNLVSLLLPGLRSVLAIILKDDAHHNLNLLSVCSTIPVHYSKRSFTLSDTVLAVVRMWNYALQNSTPIPIGGSWARDQKWSQSRNFYSTPYLYSTSVHILNISRAP